MGCRSLLVASTPTSGFGVEQLRNALANGTAGLYQANSEAVLNCIHESWLKNIEVVGHSRDKPPPEFKFNWLVFIQPARNAITFSGHRDWLLLIGLRKTNH